MAEEANKTPDPDETGSEKNDGQTNNAEDNKQDPIDGFDTSKLTDEQFESIYKDQRLFTHPRFKAMRERIKQAETLEKAQTEAETKALEEQKKYQELYEKEKTAKTELEAKVKQQAINAAIWAEASKKGITDLDAAVKLADTASVELGDDGIVTGVEAVVAKLVEDKPYLVGKTPDKSIGEGTNPGKDSTEAGTKKYKLSQLKDHKFYMENEEDIKQAWKLGLIDDDTQ